VWTTSAGQFRQPETAQASENRLYRRPNSGIISSLLQAFAVRTVDPRPQEPTPTEETSPTNSSMVALTKPPKKTKVKTKAKTNPPTPLA